MSEHICEPKYDLNPMFTSPFHSNYQKMNMNHYHMTKTGVYMRYHFQHGTKEWPFFSLDTIWIDESEIILNRRGCSINILSIIFNRIMTCSWFHHHIRILAQISLKMLQATLCIFIAYNQNHIFIFFQLLSHSFLILNCYDIGMM